MQLQHLSSGYVVSLVSGGETIRQLQVQSGAHIELHRGAHPNPAEKLFNIRGTYMYMYNKELLYSYMNMYDIV